MPMDRESDRRQYLGQVVEAESLSSAVAIRPGSYALRTPRDALCRIGLYCLVALLTGMYLFPSVRILSGVPDEGVYLYAAQRVVEGAIPGRDFVQENAPGAYYWLAWFFRLFGASVMTARMLLLMTGVATALLVFYLARRAGSRGFTTVVFVVITSIPLMPINSPHYDSNLFALAAFAVFLAGSDSLLRGTPKRWPFFIAGALAGWVSCILQQKGLLFLFAFIATLSVLYGKRAIQPIVLLVLAYAGMLAAEIVPYAIWGALPDLFFSSIKAPLSNYQQTNQVTYGFPLWTTWFPALYAQFRASASALVAAPILVATTIPFLLILVLPMVVAILGYLRRPRVFSRQLVPYWIAAYAMWASELHRQDLNHLRNGCLLLVLLFFVLCERYGTPPFKRAVLAVALGTILMGITTLNGDLHARQAVPTRRGTLFAQRGDEVLAFLLSHTRPGDYAFVYPYSPMYYFLADLRNPTPLNVIVDQRDNRLIEETITGLETKKPRYALADTKLLGDGIRTMFPGFRPPAPKDRVIDRYIDAHYHQVAFEDGFKILERNSE